MVCLLVRSIVHYDIGCGEIQLSTFKMLDLRYVDIDVMIGCRCSSSAYKRIYLMDDVVWGSSKCVLQVRTYMYMYTYTRTNVSSSVKISDDSNRPHRDVS